MVVIGPASVTVLRQHTRRPCPRRFGVIEAMAGGVGRRRGGHRQDREQCRERWKTMREDMASNARGIPQSVFTAFGIAPRDKALPANPRRAMPERRPDAIENTPPGITNHRSVSPMMRRNSSRAAR